MGNFDAIICDPPYGLRVCSRKQAKGEESGKGKFDIDAVYNSLIDLAKGLLRPGGRLVFFFHTNEKNKESDGKFLESLHQRASFELIDMSASEIFNKRKRHMITL